MLDIRKLIQDKNLTSTEEMVLRYIIENIDTVMAQGVRGIARTNFTSTSTIMRLTKKMGYTGFVDMHYRLLPLVKNTESVHNSDMQFIDSFQFNSLLKYNSYESLRGFAGRLNQMKSKYIFLYATGFSACAAEYMHKKLLVLGKKCILSSGMDSVGVFENNMDDMEMFIVISKSGETRSVLDKLKTAAENQIYTVALTGAGDNSIGRSADLWFRIEDSNPLDDRNMMPNTFFPNVLMLTELIVYEYHKILLAERQAAAPDKK